MGTMLYVDQTPPKFQSAVAYVTMGKWMGGGLLFVFVAEMARKFKNSTPDMAAYHRSSTHLNCGGYYFWFQEILKHVKNANAHWAKVIGSMNINPKECWGKGTLIFTNYD